MYPSVFFTTTEVFESFLFVPYFFYVSQDNCCKDFLSKIFQEMALKKPLPPAPLRGNQLIYVAGGYES